MKIIVLVDPLSAGEPYIPAAVAMDYRVLVLLTRDRSLYQDLHASYLGPGGFSHPQVEAFVCAATLHAALTALRQWAPDIVAVVPASDLGVESADQLAQALGLPCNQVALSMARRDKGLMKDAVRLANLRTAQYTRVDNVSSGLAFATCVGYPVVAKTPTGAASFNVFKCINAEELTRAIVAIVNNTDPFQRRQADCIIEEFIDGTEYVVNLFADGEKVHVTDVWQYTKIENQHAANLYFDTFTVDAGAPQFAALVSYAKAVVQALGISYGPVHGEFFIDAKGPVLVEIGARPAGLGMATIFSENGMFDVFTATLRAYLHLAGRDQAIAQRNRACAWIVSIPNTETGILQHIEGLETISTLPGYVAHSLAVAPGQAISPTVDLLTLPLNIWLLDRSGASLKAVAKQARESISFVMKTTA